MQKKHRNRLCSIWMRNYEKEGCGMKKFECSVAQNGFFAGPVFFIHSVTQDESIIACDIDEEINN